MSAVGRVFRLPDSLVEDRLSLKSVLNGETLDYELCLTQDNIYLQSILGDEPVITVPSASPLVYIPRVSGDRIIAGSRSFEVPYGQGTKAKKLISLGRLRVLGKVAQNLASKNPLIQLREQCPELVFLERHLAEGETLLACLETASQQPIASSIQDGDRGVIYVVITEQHCFLMACGQLGDVWVAPLPKEPLIVERKVPRSLVHGGSLQFFAPMTADDRFRALSELPALGHCERLKTVALYIWLTHGMDQGALAMEFLERAASLTDDPWVPWSQAYIQWRLQSPSDSSDLLAGFYNEDLLPALLSSDVLFHTWCETWAVPPEQQALLVQALNDRVELPTSHAFTLPIARQLYSALKSPSPQVLLNHVQHLMVAGEIEEAQGLLESSLKALPVDEVSALLPSGEVDLTEEGAEQSAEVRLLETLADVNVQQKQSPLPALNKLAQLQPLVGSRLKAVVDCNEGESSLRASRVLRILGGQLQEDYELSGSIHALGPEIVEGELEHPATRAGGQLATLQGWLGKAKVPDFGAIQAYAERLTEQAYPQAYRAVSEGILMLGLSSDLGVFISRGERSVGVRAHGGAPPFLLVGIEHLMEDSDYYMDDGALRFAVGSELAHLRFKHTRLTASEVWGGAFDMGSQVLDVSMALLGPLGLLGKAMAGVSAVAQLQRAGAFLQKQLGFVQTGAEGVATVLGASKKLTKKEEASTRGEVDNTREELLAFCRALQLTADRAGLLLCGDIAAATRGILLASRRHRSLLPLVEAGGLAGVLHRRGSGGELLEQNLAVRLRSLYAFYLSDAYGALHERVHKPLLEALPTA